MSAGESTDISGGSVSFMTGFGTATSSGAFKHCVPQMLERLV